MEISKRDEPLAESPPGLKDDAHRLPADKVRIRFAKEGDLRFISHHDLMLCFERAFRRAGIPFRSTQGFHPKPKMVFAQPLALGITGREEVLELELREPMVATEIHRRLSAQCPPGLRVVSVRAIPRSLKGRVVRVGYRLQVPGEIRKDLETRVARMMDATEIWVTRQRPRAVRYDLRPLVASIRLEGDCLEYLLWVTPNGAARAHEVLEVLGISNAEDYGASLERFALELEDEVGELEGRPQEVRSEAVAPTAAGNRHPHALLPGPMAFDS